MRTIWALLLLVLVSCGSETPQVSETTEAPHLQSLPTGTWEYLFDDPDSEMVYRTVFIFQEDGTLYRELSDNITEYHYRLTYRYTVNEDHTEVTFTQVSENHNSWGEQDPPEASKVPFTAKYVIEGSSIKFSGGFNYPMDKVQ